MTLAGNAHETEWSVDVTTFAAEQGYRSNIRVSHQSASGAFAHDFQHSGIFATEREALLEGLREGMTWVELKLSGALHV
ncbi:UDP-glucose 4-epimerase [Paraburkholderia rhizosphaerae]|uniref:UDP-glucose 4-epimerase n=1 Tax=Paraburkholderia rhizosphaerae TaxID=480658 RepID=A0A4R8LTD1_9BURK|nr:UDP-glucose 4-epimerase [Paraburkholderia rhizosphaerae]TDY50953.1 hypothetical protein BX592_108190 [Paraburkholderia rhizosphaerae]